MLSGLNITGSQVLQRGSNPARVSPVPLVLSPSQASSFARGTRIRPARTLGICPAATASYALRREVPR